MERTSCCRVRGSPPLLLTIISAVEYLKLAQIRNEAQIKQAMTIRYIASYWPGTWLHL